MEDDFISSIRPVFTLTGDTEDTRFRLDPAFNVKKYLENPDLDDIDYDIKASLMRKVTERFSADISSHFVRDSTFDAQLENAGIVTQRAERYSFDFDAGQTYALTEGLSLLAKESLKEVLYPEKELPDSRSFEFDAGPAYKLGLRDTVRLSLTYSSTDYSFFHDEGRSAAISTLQEMIIWDRDFNETTSMSIGAGHRRTWSDSTSPRLVIDPDDLTIRTVKQKIASTDDGMVFLALFKKAWTERLSTSLSAGKEQYSNVDATSFDSTYAGIEANYRLTELATLGLALRFNHNEETGGGSDKIDYVRFSPSLERKLTEHSSLRFAGSYEHEHRTGLGFDRNAERLRTWIEFVYWWPSFGEKH